MKKFSKILSVALLVALVLSLGVASAFAADPDYSITVTSALPGETYTAYKMFDLVVDNPTSPTAFTYTVNSDWTAFAQTDEFKEIFTVDPQLGYVTSTQTDQPTWSGTSAFSTLADKAAAYAKTNNITAAGSVTIEEGATSGKINLTEAGYYIISSTVGTRAMIESTPDNAAVTVVEKNEQDTNIKEVQEDSTGAWGDKNDAQVGDTVNFKTVTTVTARSINVKIHDTMSEGLTLNPSSIKVYTVYDEATPANNVEYTNAVIRAGTGTNAPDSGDTFTIDIPDSFAATATASQTLTVVYTAELNSAAVVTGTDGKPVINPATNDTYVSFGNNGKSTEDHTDTTTHKFMVYKHKGQETANLADAVFQVLKGTEVVKLIKIDATNYRVADDTEAAGTPVSHADDGELNTVEVGALVNDFVTVASGDITIWGVDSDTDYKLHEVQPPKGYNALAADKEVTVNADNNTRVDVENNTGAQLPSTGGIGTTIFYVVGGVLVLAAIILLVTKKRMSD